MARGTRVWKSSCHSDLQPERLQGLSRAFSNAGHVWRPGRVLATHFTFKSDCAKVDFDGSRLGAQSFSRSACLRELATCNQRIRKVVPRRLAQNVNAGSRRYVRNSSGADGSVRCRSRSQHHSPNDKPTQCSREWPCNHCQARKVPHLCQFGTKKPQASPSDAASRYAESPTTKHFIFRCSNVEMD